MPETAVQGPAGVSLTSNTLGPRKASQQSLGIFSPASCYVTQRNCGFAPGLLTGGFTSVTQSCPTLSDPMDCSMPGFLVHHQLSELAQTHVHRVGNATIHLILCCPLLLLPPIPPSIRVFSSESSLLMRWPKYWSFSFSIIPSKEIPGGDTPHPR